MSAYGKTIVTGVRDYSVRVYSISSFTGDWVRIGDDMKRGGESNDFSVAISSDGTSIVFGTSDNIIGNVRAYKYNKNIRDCSVSWDLYNSRSNGIIGPLVNNTINSESTTMWLCEY